MSVLTVHRVMASVPHVQDFLAKVLLNYGRFLPVIRTANIGNSFRAPQWLIASLPDLPCKVLLTFCDTLLLSGRNVVPLNFIKKFKIQDLIVSQDLVKGHILLM